MTIRASVTCTAAVVGLLGSAIHGFMPDSGMTTLPGTIEAEQFDDGGAGIAYHDDSIGNSGGQFRATDVDLEATSDDGGGYNVGWVSAGEWLNYTVNVASGGNYTVAVRVASPGAGGSFHVEVDGRDVTGSKPSTSITAARRSRTTMTRRATAAARCARPMSTCRRPATSAADTTSAGWRPASG